MQSDSNDILDSVYDNWAGTASHDPNVKEFYETLKASVLKPFSTEQT
jgi:hypothetical protein